jgi:microcystin-dependent protein
VSDRESIGKAWRLREYPFPTEADPVCLVAEFYEDATGWVARGVIDPSGGAGDVKASARSAAAPGWLLCDGTAVARSKYPALFDAIGTTFGAGDGSTTFNLPDLRGEFIRGLDAGRGVDAARVLGSAQAEMIGPHVHPMFDQSGSGGTNGSGSRYVAVTIFSNATGAKGTDANAGTENRPRNVALNYFIKT